MTEARGGIECYFRFYNHERRHQSLDYRTPAAIHLGQVMSMNDKRPEKIVAGGVPFALLNGHRAVRGVSQGFPDGAPKRRVLDRLPELLNAAEMRAKGTCEGGGLTRPNIRPEGPERATASFDAEARPNST